MQNEYTAHAPKQEFQHPLRVLSDEERMLPQHMIHVVNMALLELGCEAAPNAEM